MPRKKTSPPPKDPPANRRGVAGPRAKRAAAAAKLDDAEEQAAVVLDWLHERLTVPEIAEKRGISVRTVYRRIASATQLRADEASALRQMAAETLMLMTIEDLPECRRRMMEPVRPSTRVSGSGVQYTVLEASPDQRSMVALYGLLTRNLQVLMAGKGDEDKGPDAGAQENWQEIVERSPAMRAQLERMLQLPEIRNVKDVKAKIVKTKQTKQNK